MPRGRGFKHTPLRQELVAQIQVLSAGWSQAQWGGSRLVEAPPGSQGCGPWRGLTLLSGGEAASCCCLAMFSDRRQHTLLFCSCECASRVNKHSAF